MLGLLKKKKKRTLCDFSKLLIDQVDEGIGSGLCPSKHVLSIKFFFDSCSIPFDQLKLEKLIETRNNCFSVEFFGNYSERLRRF